MSKRRGYTLVELLATMGLVSAVLTLLAGWLTAAMHHQRVAGEHLLAISTQERLAMQFREDVQAAREALPLDPAAPEVKLRLDLGDHEVHYLPSKGGLERVEQAGDQVRRRELYRVPAERIRFDTVEAKPSLVGMHMEPSAAAQALYIEAALASDRRWERSGQ
jgi:prepilin-type N-terminal cleavage/methylation domain-containing protein